MGNRRFSRKRLFEVEKRGQTIDLESGVGIKDAIVSATQHRQGQEIITEIAIDLGTSKAAIVPGGGNGQAIGVASAASAITQLTNAKFGIITEIRVVCVEAIDATSNGQDIDIFALPGGVAANATRAQAFNVAGVGSAVTVFTGGAAVVAGRDDSYTTDAEAVKDHYLYLADGAGSASGAYNAASNGGKLVIHIHGFVAPADL
tara:strand:- start:1259 stop:1867 length:609 start_codon:yes stop_codon:yes gene_type:complete